jgi:hypothetical protein
LAATATTQHPVHLRLAVVLQADALDQLELRLEPVDVLFLGLEDVLEQLARNVVARRFAVDDAGLEVGMRRAARA